MQKKLLLSLALVSCPLVYSNNAKQAVKNVSDIDLQKGMGELAEYVQNISMEDLSKLQEETEQKMLAVQRLKWEKEILEYKKSNRQALEAALIAEISGQDGAIQAKYNENKTKNRNDETEAKNKESDHSVFWLWPTEATPKSNFGKKHQGITAVKAKKDEINKERTELVTNNKNDVSLKLKEQMQHQRYIFASVYMKELQMCSEQCKGNEDRFIECLFHKENKGNWQDIKNPLFFKRFKTDAFNAAAEYARSKGIHLCPSDIEKNIQKQKELGDVVANIDALELEANTLCNKIFYPQLEAHLPIDLTGESEERPSIFGDDLKEDQNDQGALSQ